MRANAYIASGRFDVVQSKVLQMPDDKRRDVSLMIALNENSDGAVRAALQAMPQSSVRYREFYAPLLQVLDSSADSLSLMKELADDPNRAWPSKYHDIALVAAYLGQTEFAIDVLSRDLRYTTIRFGVLWYPVMAEVRKLPEFKKFVTDVNLVAYWRKYGWSDFCHPRGPEDFVCE